MRAAAAIALAFLLAGCFGGGDDGASSDPGSGDGTSAPTGTVSTSGSRTPAPTGPISGNTGENATFATDDALDRIRVADAEAGQAWADYELRANRTLRAAAGSEAHAGAQDVSTTYAALPADWGSLDAGDWVDLCSPGGAAQARLYIRHAGSGAVAYTTTLASVDAC